MAAATRRVGDGVAFDRGLFLVALTARSGLPQRPAEH